MPQHTHATGAGLFGHEFSRLRKLPRRKQSALSYGAIRRPRWPGRTARLLRYAIVCGKLRAFTSARIIRAAYGRGSADKARGKLVSEGSLLRLCKSCSLRSRALRSYSHQRPRVLFIRLQFIRVGRMPRWSARVLNFFRFRKHADISFACASGREYLCQNRRASF